MRSDTAARRSRRGWPVTTLVLIVLAVSVGPALAVPGTLDPTFGSGGIVTTTHGVGSEDPVVSTAKAVVVQPDGRIVVAGDSTFPWPHLAGEPTTGFLVARYLPSGSVDASFTDPWGDPIVTRFAGGDDQAFAVAVQSDGRVIAAGSATVDGTAHFALARYLADGTLDASFGDGGKVVTPWDGGPSRIFAIVVEPNGRIVVAGWHDPGTGFRMALARYRQDGTLDTSFAEGGRASLSLSDGGTTALDMVRQPNGRLVVAGRAGHDLAVARFLGNGKLDDSFGEAGAVVFPVGDGFAGANGVRIRDDGGIVVAGSAITFFDEEESDHERDIVLLSLLADGTPDPWFGIDHIVTRDVHGPNDSVRGLELDAQGRLLVASRGDGRLGLTRFLPHGDVDPTFGDGGTTFTDTGGAPVAEALTVQPDGKPVIVGHRTNLFVSESRDLVLARYLVTTRPALDLDLVVTPRRDRPTDIVGVANDPATGVGVRGVHLRFLLDGEALVTAETDGSGEARAPLPRGGLDARSVVRVEIVAPDGGDDGGVEARYHPATGIDTRHQEPEDEGRGSGPR